MVKKFKQAVLYLVYLGVLIGTSLVTCWIIGALIAVGTGGYRSVLSFW